MVYILNKGRTNRENFSTFSQIQSGYDSICKYNRVRYVSETECHKDSYLKYTDQLTGNCLHLGDILENLKS